MWSEARWASKEPLLLQVQRDYAADVERWRQTSTLPHPGCLGYVHISIALL